jgi:uncharacterized iron-regulated membrane protein
MSTTIERPVARIGDPQTSVTTPDPDSPRRWNRSRRGAQRARSAAMRSRRPLVRVHRWMSFGLMAWLVVISITGAWLVEHDAIESWIHSGRYRATSGDIGLQAATQAAQAAAGPGANVDYAQTKRNSRGVYKISLGVPDNPNAPVVQGEEAPHTDVTYYVDPGTGAVNGTSKYDEGASWWLYRGHMYLWQDQGVFAVFDAESGWCRRGEPPAAPTTAPDGAESPGAEPGGVKGIVCDVIPDGGDMVAWFGVGWIVVLFTGFYLWYWPGVRRWATALVVRRRRGAFALNMSIHKVVGLVLIVPLTVVAFTGVAFALPNLSKWYDNVTPAQRDFSLWEAPEDLVSTPIAGQEALGIDDIVARLATRFPDRDIDGITPPADETGTFTAWVTRGYSPWTREDSGGNVFMTLDQYSGKVLYDGTPEAGNVFDQAWDDWSFPLHTGDFVGTPTRLLWIAVALAPLALGTTGIVMNRIRHRKRKRRAKGADTADGDGDAGDIDADSSVEPTDDAGDSELMAGALS